MKDDTQELTLFDNYDFLEKYGMYKVKMLV